MTTIFKLEQEVGIRKNPVLGLQIGIIIKIDDSKYHVLCHAIFPHKWIVYICSIEDLFMPPPPSPYKSSYSWTYIENLLINGLIYKKDETSYHIRENVPK
jgi:hypothetical protein